jgi:uncharacterized protein (DUF1810 family)
LFAPALLKFDATCQAEQSAADCGVLQQDDPFDLNRFVQAQEHDYNRALAEIRAGRKQSHWMWYIFPQIAGLGFSAMSHQYGIKSSDEANAYLAHPILGRRLLEISEAVLKVEDRTANQIFGSPDDMKLRSCATLFASVTNSDSVFHRVLQKYYAGEPDPTTLRLLTTLNANVVQRRGNR